LPPRLLLPLQLPTHPSTFFITVDLVNAILAIDHDHTTCTHKRGCSPTTTQQGWGPFGVVGGPGRGKLLGWGLGCEGDDGGRACWPQFILIATLAPTHVWRPQATHRDLTPDGWLGCDFARQTETTNCIEFEIGSKNRNHLFSAINRRR